MGVDKYYVPGIEEFHVGFECELRNSSNEPFEWEHFKVVGVDDGEISGSLMDWSFYDSANAIKDGMVRVKYLDAADIEECGWVFVEKSGVLKFKQKEPYDYKGTEHEVFWNLWLYDDNKVIIHNGLLYDSEVTLFTGRIKNKSELKRLMKQLWIWE